MDGREFRTKREIQEDFPNLKLDEFEITSKINFCYNCFAWAGGFDDLIMQPSTNPIYGWVTGKIGETLDNFEEQFQHLRFERTDNAENEEGIEKAAFYVKNNEVQHAARQLENGWWASKLGQFGEDIEHKTLQSLEGDEYGEVKMIMKRPATERKQVSESERVSEDAFDSFQTLARNLVNVPKKEVDDLMKKSNKKKTKK